MSAGGEAVAGGNQGSPDEWRELVELYREHVADLAKASEGFLFPLDLELEGMGARVQAFKEALLFTTTQGTELLYLAETWERDVRKSEEK